MRAVRLAHVSWLRRRTAVEMLNEKRGMEVEVVESVDAEVRDVAIKWRNGAMGRVVIGERGEVQKVVALDVRGRRDVSRQRRLGVAKRVEDLERVIGRD